MAHDFRRLIEQSLWANLRWVELVYGKPVPETRPRELLGHLMVGERAWLERIEGEQKTTAMFPQLDKDELVRGFGENAEALRRLVDARPDDVVHFRRATGEAYHARILDIVAHLVTHGYHHRGQIAAHFARGGVSYPNTDYINFLIQNNL